MGVVSPNILLFESAFSNMALREIVAGVALVSILLASDKYPFSEPTKSGS
jgi:hypothetical protein